jgi:5-methylcytosine-specific restriction protein B
LAWHLGRKVRASLVRRPQALQTENTGEYKMTTPIQRIVFGSPGTGKSYRIDNDDKKDGGGGIIRTELGIEKEKNPENIIKAVFHPEYTYGDFMGKLVPITTRSGKIQYNFYQGHFLNALSRAYENLIDVHDSDGKPIEGRLVKNVVLVIDEINRGNSSAIFGPIFQLLDRDAKGWSDYCISINEIIFNKILELIGVEFSFDEHGKIKGYTFGDKNHNIKELQKKFDYLGFDLINKSIKIPCNLSIIATMNTSDSSIYYMDSAFKRRWEWEFIDVDSKSVQQSGIAFNKREEWMEFVKKLNEFIIDKHKYIRGIEDKQIGQWFIKDSQITNATIQNKLMFFIWDSVFSRDKKPLVHLLYGDDAKKEENQDKLKLVTFGDFAKKVELFIEKIKEYKSDNV